MTSAPGKGCLMLYELDKSHLNSALAANNIDPAIRQSIINFLVHDGDFAGDGKVTVQEGDFPPLNPSAQVLILDTPSATIPTDHNLKVIVDGDADLTVTGNNSVFVATGPTGDRVDLTGSSGNDTVMSGSGPDTILAGSGADSIVGGLGNDSIR